MKGLVGPSRVRVLWLTTNPLPAVALRQGMPAAFGCGWQSAALAALSAEAADVQFVCAARPSQTVAPFESSGIQYVSLEPRRSQDGLRRAYQSWMAGLVSTPPVEEMKRLIEDVRPDIIHVHGTETSDALAVLLAAPETPILVTLQGLVSEIAPLTLAGLRRADIFEDVCSLKFARGRGLVHESRHMRKAAAMELAALRRARDVSGRTDWDRGVVRRANPAARYWHIDEALRQPFHEVVWRGPTEGAPTILAVTSDAPRKGVDVLLRGFAKVRSRRPCALKVVGGVVGTPVWRSLSRLESSLGLTGHVDWVGGQSAESVARMLSECTVFVCASRIENSPNSVCEAMLVGVPVVASRVGGMQSLVNSGEDGLLFESGDDEALARTIELVASDELLASRLGDRARARASVRHDPAAVSRRTLDVYASLVGEAT